MIDFNLGVADCAQNDEIILKLATTLFRKFYTLFDESEKILRILKAWA